MTTISETTAKKPERRPGLGRLRRRAGAMVAVPWLFWASWAWAQTAVSDAPRPARAARPVPASAVRQAEAQNNGEFPAMRRAAIGGQVQEAWDDAAATDGVVRFAFCDGCVYKVRLREHMVTVIELPAGETATRADVGDGGNFRVLRRGARRLAVKPQGMGVDTDLVVYGESGTTYPFYLRAESFNSKNVPDLIVRVVRSDLGGAEPDAGVVPEPADGGASPSADAGDSGGSAADFVETVPFDPDALRGWGDYRLWSGGPDGAALKPETVFRDDIFTYIRFGDNWGDVEFPTAYVVVDGIDEVVNTRRMGRTYVVESVHRLITLKSGKSYLCIQYTGDR